MANRLMKVAVGTLMLAASPGGPVQATGPCKSIGGMARGEAMDDSHFVATLAGAFSSAAATVTSRSPTGSGLRLGMSHVFMSTDGGMIRTRDDAVLTAIPDREGSYMLEITYDVQSATGTWEGYGGRFRSFGLIRLPEGAVALRYAGELCPLNNKAAGSD